MPLNLNNLEDADAFQRHFVLPVTDAIKAELKPLVEKVEAHEKSINSLQTNQKRALVGMVVLGFLGTLGFNGLKSWAAKRFNWSI